MSKTDSRARVVGNRSGYGPGEAPRWADYSRCVRCGLCLNACPTYRELGLEMDSPRGRIYQMIQVERGRLPLGESFVRHIDLCLDCRACETACPSGVEYGKLVEATRGQIEKYYKRPPLAALLRKLFFYEILPYRQRLEVAGKILRFYQRSGLERLVLASRILKLLPWRLERVAGLAPRMEKPFFTERLGTVVPAVGTPRYRVAFFAGCIANLSFARLNDATVRVLAKNGCEVVIPTEQGCCGALHVHAGMRDLARELAKRNIRAFLAGSAGVPPAAEGERFPYGGRDARATGEFDAIITNAAGCGSVLKEYPLLFQEEDRDYLERARAFSGKLRDVTEFLAGIDFNKEFAVTRVRATYQDSCHLAHAQKIRSAPRKLLAAVPGLELVELKESEICCGSAGIYNVVHNDLAEKVLQSKMQRIEETEADLILTANPGCLLQLRAAVSRAGGERRVLHVVELLDEAYRGLTS